MEETGKIIKKEKNIAFVEVKKGLECKGCSMREACPESSQEGYKLLKVLNPIDADVDDKVMVECKPSRSVLSSFIIFIFPLIIMFVGYYIGVLLFGSEAEFKSILLSIVALVFAFIIIKFVDKYVISKKEDFVPFISKKI